MSSSERHGRQSLPSSPPLSVAPSSYSVSHATSIGQQRLNVVTRVAIEGRSERGANGASIKMYLKVNIECLTTGACDALSDRVTRADIATIGQCDARSHNSTLPW